MKTTIVFGVLLALALSDDVNFEEAPAPKNELDEVEDDAGETSVSAKAASSQVNCRCQCSSITFLDKYGQINGNCRSADRTGALWCYVDPRYSQCPDLQRSVRFQSLWSYNACATPELTSRLCSGYVPAVGNGVGAGALPAGVPNLAPGPEGFPFTQYGGYPGLTGGSGSGAAPSPRKNGEKETTEGSVVFSQ
jgi:hypothetical protein